MSYLLRNLNKTAATTRTHIKYTENSTMHRHIYKIRSTSSYEKGIYNIYNDLRKDILSTNLIFDGLTQFNEC